MKIHFTSDNHFGHRSIIRFCTRPFDSVTDMDMAMIENWNKVVSPKDTIYHIGDFAFYRDINVTKEILRALNGRKILIAGNHDRNNVRSLSEWNQVHQYFELKHQGYDLILFHYPIGSWNKSFHNSFHLHGHSHGKYTEETWDNGNRKLRLDVGVDTHNFTPWEFDEIVEYMNAIKKTNVKVNS